MSDSTDASLSGPRLLVVGAAPNSLGAAIAAVAREGVWAFEKVLTAGISPLPETLRVPGSDADFYEDYRLNIQYTAQIREVLRTVCPDIVICTVGVNTPTSLSSSHLALRLEEAFRVNVIGVLELLRHFVEAPGSGFWTRGPLSKKFVVVSSNSARIARRSSLAYCASKAALSMAVRVAARELAGDPVQVWGYEPGLLAGTPMTTATAQMLPGPWHRMPGIDQAGLAPRQLAHQIINDVANHAPGLNGVLIPFDAGEQ